MPARVLAAVLVAVALSLPAAPASSALHVTPSALHVASRSTGISWRLAGLDWTSESWCSVELYAPHGDGPLKIMYVTDAGAASGTFRVSAAQVGKAPGDYRVSVWCQTSMQGATRVVPALLATNLRIVGDVLRVHDRQIVMSGRARKWNPPTKGWAPIADRLVIAQRKIGDGPWARVAAARTSRTGWVSFNLRDSRKNLRYRLTMRAPAPAWWPAQSGVRAPVRFVGD